MAPPCQKSARAVSCAAARVERAALEERDDDRLAERERARRSRACATNSARRMPCAHVFASSARSPRAANVESDGSAAVESAMTKMPCGKSQRRIAHEK